ncbi:hypothetical protein AK830_g12690, partial [Neonectria ditissima]
SSLADIAPRRPTRPARTSLRCRSLLHRSQRLLIELARIESTKNRAAVVFSIQSWLGESEDAKKNSTTPGYFSVGMAIMSLAITYLPMFLPPVGGAAKPAALT